VADPEVARWQQTGQVYLWRYTEGARDYPGWHMTADPTACTSLFELIDRMTSARWPSNVLISVSKPTGSLLRVPNNRGDTARCKSPESLRLKHSREIDRDHWSLVLQDRILILTLGSGRLLQLRQGIADIASGHGDYAIGPGNLGVARDRDSLLWFWWRVED
jgi:hypothetical protein